MAIFTPGPRGTENLRDPSDGDVKPRTPTTNATARTHATHTSPRFNSRIAMNDASEPLPIAFMILTLHDYQYTVKK
jgi:hypothetical protein